MAFCTYLYQDPKAQVWRYVGKGLEHRPYQHITNSARGHPKLQRMLRKRIREGFNPQPIVLAADSEVDAFEMEELLIALIGREDLGAGTLFNKTNGGEGTSGRIISDEERLKKSISMRNRPADAKAKTFGIQSAKKHRMWESWSDEQRSAYSLKQSLIRLQPCTIDECATVFPSRVALIDALGQSRRGSRSPNFRYLTPEEKIKYGC